MIKAIFICGAGLLAGAALAEKGLIKVELNNGKVGVKTGTTE